MNKEKKQDFPSNEELVVIKIEKVHPYGASCSFSEYPGIEGFLSVKEVASKWIRNINDFVKEGMVSVAKVISCDKDRRVAEISLRRVNDDMRKKRLEEFQNENKAKKIISVAFSKAKIPFNVEIFDKIYQDYDTLYDLLLDINEDAESGKGYFSEKVIEELCELLKSSIKKQKAEVKAIAHITVIESDGIERIKDALKKLKVSEISYLGAPRYLLKIVDENYKTANAKMKKAEEALQKEFKSGKFSFERIEQK